MSATRLPESLLAMPRSAKRLLAVIVDSSLCALTVWLAICLGDEGWATLDAGFLKALIGAWCLSLPVFVRLGLYRAIFRFSGTNAMMHIAWAVTLYGAMYALVFTVVGVPGVPRSVGIVQPLLLAVMVMGIRTLVRFWLGNYFLARDERAKLPRVAIYGAGAAGRQLAAGLSRAAHENRLVAFIDDDRRLTGRSMDGRRIYHPDDLAEVVDNLHLTDVLLAIPSVDRMRRNEIVARLRTLPVHVRTVPGLSDLAAGRVDLSDVRELDVEDLLGRDPVAPDLALLNKNTQGRVVVVTGAGGSIGSELCRQILQCHPSKLLLAELSEFALYQIHRELEAAQREAPALSDVELVPLLASVQDKVRMNEIMRTWRPDTVYHAAAYKHVPLVEHNPAEGIRNNVWGTWTCAEAAAAHGVRNFVLISTDKAVRPTNIMGASKRLAEMVLQAKARLAPSGEPGEPGTTFTMVRFGNVLGSSGSVVPLFREQITGGGPVTLTHPDITRFFMTIPEAAQLVIQAGAMGVGGDVFVLDMGQPVRIIDLARRMIELSGRTVRDEAHPEGDIEIRITGLRPGEKLYEELLIGEDPERTHHPRIIMAHEECLPWAQLAQALCRLERAILVNDIDEIRGLLGDLVSGYQAAGEVVDWVYCEQARADVKDSEFDRHLA